MNAQGSPPRPPPETPSRPLKPLGRFMVFDIEAYYPSGGVDDLAGRFDTLQKAMAHKMDNRFGHIYDVEQGKVCARRWSSSEWVLGE